MEITLNGEKVTVTPHRGSKPGAEMSIDYETLADLAGLAGCTPSLVWSAPDKTRGIVSLGARLKLAEGMNITAIVTGAA